MSELQIKKNIAQELRKRGYLYSQIATELGVSKSTASAWTKLMKLSSYEKSLVEKRQLANRRDRINNLAVINKEKRIQREALLNLQAKQVIKQVKLDRFNKQLTCALLFWCEGGKDTGAGVKFINSDPIMIETFLKLLRDSFDIDEKKLRAMLHLHNYHDVTRQLNYWSDITSIPLSQFYNPYMKPNTEKNKRRGYPGCISLRYLDASVGKLLKMIYTEFGNNIGV